MLNNYPEEVQESFSVTNKALKAALSIMIQEIQTECAIYNSLSKPDKHNLPGEYKSFIGSDFDKTIYRNLLTAITGTASNFETNPKKTCLELSIGICLKMPYRENQSFEKSGPAIPPLTDEDKATLQLILKLTAPYTDKELFYVTTDNNILKIRTIIERATRGIPLFNKIRSVVSTSYERALQDAAILQLKLDDEVKQDSESNRDIIEQLNRLLVAMEQADRGEVPVVFMDKITYPSTIATCTCGNESCHAPHDARDLLRARIVANSSADYVNAFQRVYNRFVNSDNFQSNSVIHNAGIVMPFICENCGAVNIPSEGFLYIFKLCVLNKWMQSPPSQRNKDAMLTYSASVIIDGVSAILQNDQERVQETLQGYRPLITAEKVEVKIPDYSLADLVSSETYTAYMSMLNVHSSSRSLQDFTTRQQLFLQYMLSTLHLATVDSSPAAVIESILSFSQFKRYRESLESASKQLYELSIAKKRADLIRSVITSEYYQKPMNGYVDMILSKDFVMPLIDKLSDTVLAENLRQDPQAALTQLNNYISSLETGLKETTDSITTAVESLFDDLFKYECELYRSNATTVEEFELVPLVDNKGIGLVLSASPDTNKDSYIYKCETCNMLWEHLEALYIPLMYQTVVYFSSILENNPMVFNGLFTSKPKDIEKTAIKLCNSMGLNMRFTNPTSYKALFGEVLFACLQVDSTTQLMNALNISEGRLLRSYTILLPTNQHFDTFNTYSVLDEVNFPVGLSLFARGMDISDYQSEVQQVYQNELETSISSTESLAVAECAASFYIAFSPLDTNKLQLQEQLGGNKFVNSFEI